MCLTLKTKKSFSSFTFYIYKIQNVICLKNSLELNNSKLIFQLIYSKTSIFHTIHQYLNPNTHLSNTNLPNAKMSTLDIQKILFNLGM